MSGSQLTIQSPNSPINCLFSPFTKCKNSICANPLLGRITADWKVLLMDCSTIVSATCVVVTFLTGAPFLCSAFFFASFASGVGAFYMRQFAVLPDLQRTAQELKETKEKVEILARELQRENARLAASNRNLTRNNNTFRASNQTLIQTNTRLNHQVTQLTLQVTGLRESAEKIQSEMVRFQRENGHLRTHVRGFNESLRTLDGQILSSRALCKQIAGHLTTQNQELGQQLEQLGKYLSELRADDRVHEKIQELGALQKQISRAAGQLHTIQLQYAAERAHFQAIREALVQLKDQFDQAIREASGGMQANNRQLRANVVELGVERQRISKLLNRHFPEGPR